MTRAPAISPALSVCFDDVLDAAAAAYQSGRTAEADRHVHRALELADEHRVPNGLARALALRTDPGFNVDDTWLGYFDRAWQELDDRESTLAVELLRSQIYASYLSDPNGAARLADRAVELAARLDDDRADKAALDAQRLAIIGGTSLESMIAVGQRLADHGRRGDREAGAKGYEALIFAAMLGGDIAAAERHLAAFRACAAATGNPRHQLAIDATLTMMAISRGELDDAQNRLASTLATATSVGDSLAIQVAMAQQVAIAIERDQFRDALVIGRHQLDNNPMLRWWKLGSLMAATRPGNEAEAADLLDCVAPDQASLDNWRFLWLGELVVLTDAAALIGDTERAARLRDMLAPHTDRYAILATTVGFGSIWRPVAEATALLGDYEQANREFELAEAANKRIAALPDVCRGRLGHARLLHRLGRVDEAREKLTSAENTAQRLGLIRLQHLAESVRAMIGSDSSTVPLNLNVPGLTPREVELLAAVAEGSTNRQLADQFFVSVKTIERHLSNIYTKLGVRTRGEAVDCAFGDPIDGARNDGAGGVDELDVAPRLDADPPAMRPRIYAVG